MNARLCILRVKGSVINYSIFNIHAPTNDSNDEAKDLFYEELERAYSACLGKSVKEDANAKIGQETIHHPSVGKYSLHGTKNENGLRLINFAAGRQMAIRSTYFMYKKIHLQTWHSSHARTFNQIDHFVGTTRTSSV
jgi:hypothetical protein